MGRCREGYHISGTSKMSKEQKETEKKKVDFDKNTEKKRHSEDKREKESNKDNCQTKAVESNDVNAAIIQSFLGGLVRREVINLLQPMLGTGHGSVLTTPAGPSQPTHQPMAQVWPSLPAKKAPMESTFPPNQQLPMPVPQATVDLLRLLLQPQGSQ